NLFLIPALFLIMIFLAIRAVTLPGASRGIVYLFTPRGEQLGEASTWISALAQSAWSCSAGMGMALTYGVYMRRKEDTTLNAVLTGLGNNSASLIVGIAVFSTVFALSPTPAAADAALQEGGTGLTFIYLTALFATMPFGALVAFFFFLATAFAALTSMLSTYELAVRNFMDFGLSRKRAVLYMSAATFLLGLPSAAVVLNMGGRPVPVILENQDHVWGLALLLTGLMLYLLLRSYGVRRFRENFINSRWSDIRVGRWFDVLFNYVVPVEIAVLFVWYFYQTLTGPSENWWVSGPIGLALMLIQWAGVIVLLRYLVNRYSHKIDLSDVEYSDFYGKVSVKTADGNVKRGKPIVYGITIPKNAQNPSLARSFVAFVLSEEGRKTLEECGQEPIVPAVGEGNVSALSSLRHLLPVVMNESG
ncbi:MAG: extracellular solute-binding protein, partial [Canidatus Methanoxibalbensis ujae]|nr:extracellular solute-binding protein [Candidatus Methanoxibalbensis ujae]